MEVETYAAAYNQSDWRDQARKARFKDPIQGGLEAVRMWGQQCDVLLSDQPLTARLKASPLCPACLDFAMLTMRYMHSMFSDVQCRIGRKVIMTVKERGIFLRLTSAPSRLAARSARPLTCITTSMPYNEDVQQLRLAGFWSGCAVWGLGVLLHARAVGGPEASKGDHFKHSYSRPGAHHLGPLHWPAHACR